MKKNFKFMLVALLALFGVNGAFAQSLTDFNDDAYYYKVKSSVDSKKTGIVYIDKFNAAPGAEVTLPSTFKKNISGVEWTITVTGIEDHTTATDAAFYGQTQITKVTIPATIEYIGKNAFYGCTNLAAIDLSNATGLKEIADQAFVTIQVKEYDFSKCTKLVGFPETGSAFVESGKEANSYIEKMTLPTSTTFKTIGTSLAKLPKLATLNISESKIQSVVANAFEGDALLTAMELPKTVKTIASDAFTKSKVADLTINVDAIDPTKGIEANVYAAGDDKKTLTKLTLKGTLKGKISANAFNDHDLIADGDLVLSGLNFGTNASILSNAFGSLALIESITLGNIGDNGSTAYTIGTNAFNGPKLTSVTIGDITAPKAIDGHAFDDGSANTLTSVTISSVKSGGLAIAADAFNFAEIKKDAKATVTIGAVRAQDLATKIIGAGAFTFSSANAGAAEIKIGAIESAGSVFTASAFKNCAFTQGITLTFTGDIEYNGLDEALLDATTNLTKLNFNGKIGAAGIGSSAAKTIFADMPEKAVITFAGSLAENAVAEKAFLTSTNKAFTIKYTATPDDPSVNPFNQKAFLSTQLSTDAERFVTLTITNEELKALIGAGQISCSDPNANDDIIYGIKFVIPAAANTLVVYQNNGTTNSYGRWQLTATDYPNGIKIARRGHDGVKTLTLYTTYVENDATNKVVTINMQPIPSVDGMYVIPTSAMPIVIIAKATGTSKADTEIEYTEPAGTDIPSTLYTDNNVKVAQNVVTNQQLRDRTGYDGTTPLDAAALDDNDIYFISNPKNYKGVSANTYDYTKASNIFIGEGSFYVIAPHYDGASAARIVWLDGEETAIESVKNVAAEAGVVYNLAGQKVDANYKGIVIKNGKKMIQK